MATYRHRFIYLMVCTKAAVCHQSYTYDCVSYHESTQVLIFAGDTIVLRLIINSDESEYRDSINKRICWCRENNRELNVNKTKEMIVDLRRKISSHISPLLIDGRTVEIFQCFKFLGSIISNVS